MDRLLAAMKVWMANNPEAIPSEIRAHLPNMQSSPTNDGLSQESMADSPGECVHNNTLYYYSIL